MWKILLIEDDEDDYILINGLLSEAREGKYSLQWERNYMDGITAARSGVYDAILVDNILGPELGIDLIHVAIDEKISSPMILLTGKGRETEDLDALRAGANDFLDKNLLSTVLLEKTIRYAIERKQTDAEIRRTHREHADILASIQDAFLSVNANWDIRYANRQAAAMTRKDADKLVGANLWSAFPFLTFVPVETRLRKALEVREPTVFEIPASNKNSWLEVRVHPSIDGLSILLVDISERKHVEAERNEALEEMNVAMEQLRVSTEEAEQAAQQAQATAFKLTTILDHLTDGVIVLNSHHEVVQVNENVLQMLGFNPTQMSLKTMINRMDIQVEDGNPGQMVEYKQLYRLDGKPVLDLPVNLTSSSGRQYFALYSKIPLEYSAETGGHIVILKDITDEVQARKQVQGERDRLQDLITGMTEGFAVHEIVCDENGKPVDYRFLEINPAFERLTGLKRDEVVGKLVRDVLPDEDPDWIRIYGEVALTGNPVHFENYSPALKQYYDVYSYCPVPGQFAVLFMNITERKRMEQDLRVNLAKYTVLFEAFPLGITVTDEEGNILETNSEAERLLDLSEVEHMQKRIDDPDWQIITVDGLPFPTDDYPSVRAIKENKRVANVEMGIVHRDQNVVWLNVTATPLPIEGYGVVVAYNDVTDRKHMEAEKVQHLAQIEVQRRLIRQRELERLQVARSLHDGPFQTLNAANMGLMDAIQQETNADHLERLKWVQDVFNQEIREFRQFIQELRPPALVSFGLETTIRSHVETFSQLYPNIKTELSLARDGKALPEETRLAVYRIYQDIMSNLGRHSDAETAWISLEVTPQVVILRVVDDGVGFSVPEKWAQFALSDHLGLISMRERSEMIGAKLEIISHPGEGTTVSVIVPRDGVGS